MNTQIVKNESIVAKEFKMGSLYYSPKFGTIVLCTGDGEHHNTFKGVCIQSDCHPIGYTPLGWENSAFIPFKGEIRLFEYP